ncbi:predicted protein [Coccidioides posadasii str. Silveira]|uniref:Predicted protein n=2 Tax=Coccidioides posadasii TaxID=199306 RepID=E9CWG0_COCPS|nr:predicted protein [Coccidioides posadasii str. Silveira]KMM65109.1 hypothetical protein CPAG_01461 [Coccidioides posadasii RMSCC 3488]
MKVRAGICSAAAQPLHMKLRVDSQEEGTQRQAAPQMIQYTQADQMKRVLKRRALYCHFKRENNQVLIELLHACIVQQIERLLEKRREYEVTHKDAKRQYRDCEVQLHVDLAKSGP